MTTQGNESPAGPSTSSNFLFVGNNSRSTEDNQMEGDIFGSRESLHQFTENPHKSSITSLQNSPSRNKIQFVSTRQWIKKLPNSTSLENLFRNTIKEYGFLPPNNSVIPNLKRARKNGDNDNLNGKQQKVAINPTQAWQEPRKQIKMIKDALRNDTSVFTNTNRYSHLTNYGQVDTASLQRPETQATEAALANFLAAYTSTQDKPSFLKDNFIDKGKINTLIV